MYNLRVYNHKTNSVEYLTVTLEELKEIYNSIWYDIFDIQKI